MPKWFMPATIATLLVAGCQQASQPDQPIHQPANDTSAAAPEAPAHELTTTASVTPTYRAFKDYVVGCDNTLHCTAVAARTDDQIRLTLVLQRDAGPSGAASLKIASITGDPLPAARLMLDGKPSQISELPWVAGADGTLELTDAASILRFLALVKDASHIRLGQDQDNDLSLKGFNAALLYIDAAQGRLDTLTAFAKPGQMPADTVPVAPRAPELPAAYKPVPPALSDATVMALTKAVRAQASAALKAADCSFDASPDSIGADDDAIALTPGEALVFLTCNSGAYQSEALLYRTSMDGKSVATRLMLPPTPFAIEDGRAMTFETLVGVDYDPATATLSEFSKGRGLADCGSHATWRFGGKDFHLASVKAMDRCSGVSPDDWPSNWRTQP